MVKQKFDIPFMAFNLIVSISLIYLFNLVGMVAAMLFMVGQIEGKAKKVEAKTQ